VAQKSLHNNSQSDDNNERLELVINTTGVGIWDWQIKTGELTFNSRWAEIIGYTIEELLPIQFDTWSNSLHPDDLQKAERQLEQHFSGKVDLYEIEARMMHKSGHYVWVLASGKIVEREKGEPKRMIGTHLDITERKNNEQRMIVNTQLLNESQQVGKLGGWELDLKTNDLFWTDETYRIHDTSPDDFNPTVDAGVGYFLPESKNIISKALGEAISHGKDYDLELETYTTKGRKIDIRTTCHVTLEKEVPIRLTGIFQDISVQKANQRKLEKTNIDLANANAALTLAASVFTHAGEGIIITDANAKIIDVNDTFTATSGYSREDAIGRNPNFLHSGRQSPEFYADMWRTLIEEGVWSGEVWNRRKNNEVYAEMLNITSVKDVNGQISNFVGLFTDITLIKEQQEKLELIAHYDILTNLPNRVLLADRLSQAMLQCNRHKKSLAVVFLDLDGFKHVNDVHGHNVGDELLISLSQRMKIALREGDSLARIGGDEFVAVLTDLTKVEDCEPVLKRLLLASSAPVNIDDVIFNVSASIGVTLYPQDNVDGDLLMRHADQAMYMAKELGKNRYHLFDTAQDDAIKLQRENLETIRRALDNNEFVLFYQPKVNMRTGLVMGVEALIRWQHPERGLLNPIEFLPIIENNPMSIEIGEWVINTALSQISQWQEIGLNCPVSTSVNIAAVQLQQPDFAKKLTKILAAHPTVEPKYLELEVLETSALDDVSHVSKIMNECMTLGVKFALDDFGTGYSSLTYLRRLPANLIKIDQSFVRDMLNDEDDLAIVEGVIALAKSFKRDVIAEGVETIEHGTALLQLGCEAAQGYGIARPMPAKDIPSWIKHWKPDANWQK
jgi:diguanylate cyclase (GGDEF)-like protein/PAS domain S-box-containing protein